MSFMKCEDSISNRRMVFDIGHQVKPQALHACNVHMQYES